MMTQSGQDRPVVAATPLPAAGGDVVGVAMALLEAAALAAAMRRVGIWNPYLHLDAAADRAWASAGSGGQGEWRTDPGPARGRVALGGAGGRGHHRPLLG
jgi:hypothetical protein